jgi:hypothetical protein
MSSTGVFPKTEQDARERILKSARVTPEMVTQAKDIILDRVKTLTLFAPAVDSELLIEDVLKELRAPAPPRELYVHETVDSTSNIQSIGESLAWRFAVAEAVLSLVHTGFLLKTASDVQSTMFYVECHQGVQGQARYSSTLKFNEYQTLLPGKVRLADSRKTS